MMDYQFIDKNIAMSDYLQYLKEEKITILALDLEAEYNLHVYGEKLCLIQIFDGKRKIIIDPFRVSNGLIKTLLENERIMKIMYDASNDLSLMINKYHIKIKSILDLRPAPELLGFKKHDLHSVINQELRKNLDKKSKYQKYNWIRRPIKDDAMVYALNDVIYLFKLKDKLLKRLYKKKLMEDFLLRNLIIQTRNYRKSSKDRYKKVKGFYGLSRGEAGIFKKLYDIRDRYAKKWNQPPNNVINKQSLLLMTSDEGFIDRLRLPRKVDRLDFMEMKNELKRVVGITENVKE